MEDVGVAVGARLGGIVERVWSDMGEGVVVLGGMENEREGLGEVQEALERTFWCTRGTKALRRFGGGITSAKYSFTLPIVSCEGFAFRKLNKDINYSINWIKSQDLSYSSALG